MTAEVQAIMLAIESAGFESYIVGGAVRDRLLGLPVKDYDLATNATPAQLLESLPGAVEVHSRAKAPVVVYRHHEIASFRSESGRREAVVFTAGDMASDATRRDFTVNALYEDRAGKVYDPTGEGLADIGRGVLRFVGDGAARIIEDPTRILRGFRLRAAKGFCFEAECSRAIEANASELSRLAVEQVGRELRKLMVVAEAGEVACAFRCMGEHGVLAHILPELEACRGVEQNEHHQEGDVFKHTMEVLKHTRPVLTLRMAALLHDVGKVLTQIPRDGGGFRFPSHNQHSTRIAKAVLTRLNVFDRAEREEILYLVENHMRAHNITTMNRGKLAPLLRHPSSPLLLELLEADCRGRLPVKLEALQANLDAARRFHVVDRTPQDLGINATLLMSLGQKPGKALGEKLRMMANLLNKHPERTKAELLQAVGFGR